MSSPSKDHEEPSSSSKAMETEASSSGAAEDARPPSKRRISSTVNAVIEISDTESDDSDVCAVNSYQATADEVKRIRGDADYSSSSSSSSDYSSDSESPWEDDSVVVEDYKVYGKAVRTQLNPRAPRTEDPTLNPHFKSQELIDSLKSHWRDQKDLSTPEVTLTCEPFRLCLLHNLLTNEDFINNIVDDMNTLDWSRKKMDLYEFHQTADLANLTWQRSIRGIYELLRTEVMPWVSSVTGVELSSVSASCSLYGPGDHLLVHDDLLGDRRVAFILYLAPWRPPPQTPLAPLAPHAAPLQNGDPGDHVIEHKAGAGWAASMGGGLELLSLDAAGRPDAVRRRVLPANNMLAFFKVGRESFHQVGEVLSLELPRLSVNGWFHAPGPEPEAAPEPEAEPPPRTSTVVTAHHEVVLLNQWVDATYMSPRSRLQIQAQMERASEVCLHSILQEHKYQELLEALRDPALPWERAGPGDARRHARLPASWRAGGGGGGGGAAPGGGAAAPGLERGLRAHAGRLHRPGARRTRPPRPAAMGRRGLHPAAAAGGGVGVSPGGAAVPGRAGPAAERRRHALRVGGRAARAHAGVGAARLQRAQPGVLRGGRGRLHQVPQPRHHAPRGVLLPALRRLPRVTSLAGAARALLRPAPPPPLISTDTCLQSKIDCNYLYRCSLVRYSFRF